MRRPFFPFALLPALLAIEVPLVDALAQPVQPAPSSTASASPAPAQDDADRLFREGNELYKQKRFADAEALFEKAFAKKPAHDIATNLGYVELYQNKLVETAEHLSYAVRIWPPTGKDDKRQGAIERLAKVKAEVATLTIEVNVAGAHVTIGEREVGTSPIAGEVFADAGRMVVRAKREGYLDAERAIDVAKGSAQTVTLEMKAAPVNVPTATATASATTTAAPPTRSMVPAYVIGGVGVASLIVGGVLLGVSGARKADAEKLRDETVAKNGPKACATDALAVCKTQRDALNEATTLFNAGTWMLIGAGVAAAGTVLYVLVTKGKAPPPAQAGLIVTPTGGAAAMRLSF